ncbi:MAG: pyridoxal phosphate-dependent aminotransferase [Firmicutes bacterium]|nr:pyridoxal phosphate-dependent aminotransferase [Bacillota bacterium]
MKLSERVAAMQFSPIRKFNPLGFKAEEDGKTVYRLNIGQPDVETPACFMDAIKNFDKKVIAYAESSGVNELLDAIIKYNGLYGIELNRENIIVTNGGSEALSLVFTAIMNPGDAAMMAEPYYTNYSSFLNQANGTIVPITTTAETGYAWADKELLEKSITPNTKALCCISPGNPTGRVLTLDEMKIVGEFAKEHDLWIISDEVYREFAYDDRKVASFGMLPEYADRVILIDSVSKRFSACGARIGCIVSKNRELMDGVLKLAQGRLCSPTLEQVGAAALYNLGPDYFAEAKATYEARRNAAYEEISQIPGVVCQKPGGAFYLMAKLPIESSEDFLMYMLTEFEDKGETVMFTPAEGFYRTPGMGKNEIRIAYVLEADKMRRAAELIKLGIESYKAKKA